MSTKKTPPTEYQSVQIPRFLIETINFLRKSSEKIKGVEGFKGYKYRSHAEYIIEAIRDSVRKDIKLLYYVKKQFQGKK